MVFPQVRMSVSAEASLEELAAEFDLFDGWEDRYHYVIDLGRDLAPLADAERSDATKVRGCASQVWLICEPLGESRLRFRGDSDAHIVRGLIAILLRFYSGRTAEEILAFDAGAAIERLGLAGALSAQRANGLAAMVRRIRADAAAVRATRDQAALPPAPPKGRSATS